MDDEIDPINKLRERVEQNPDDGAALEQLIRMAQRDRPSIIRVNAVAALGEAAVFVPEHVRISVVGALVIWSRDALPEIRRASYRALSKCAKSGDVPDKIVAAGLRERNTDIASFAVDLVLRERQFGTEVVAALVDSVQAGQKVKALETVAAISALGVMRNPPPNVVDSLGRSLLANDATVRCEAALALANFGKKDQLLVQTLSELMDQPNYLVRLRALDAVALMVSGDRGVDLTELLHRGASDANPAVRMRAERILGKRPGSG